MGQGVGFDFLIWKYYRVYVKMVLHLKNIKEVFVMKEWMTLEKMYFVVDPPAEVSNQEVEKEMEKISHRKGCVVEFYCRGNLRKIKPR